MATLTPLIAIVGTTASGKTSLALELAEKFDGEIICADSRTVYKGMDIGTAKPTKEEQARVPHHLLDVVRPDQPFTVADFKHLADKAIKEITAHGKMPLLVGGSGLYIDAVLYDYGFSDQSASRDADNPRHLSKDMPRVRSDLRPGTLIIGLDIPREALARRIEDRVDKMIEDGFVDELKTLQSAYPESNALLATGYKAFLEYIEGTISLAEAKARFIQNDLHLAKRQRTWFRRNNSIQWVSDPRKAVEIATTFLSKIQ